MKSKSRENILRNFLKNIDFVNIALVISLLAIVCIVYFYNTRDIELKIAYGGFGPQDYVSQKLHPENYQKDWQNGILVYDNSLPMKVFYYLAKYFGISPTKTIYPFMFIQTLLFVMSVAFLVQTLFNNKFITFISVPVMLLSHLAGLDLSRFATRGFGGYLSFSLYYAYAGAFSLFAIGFFLRNKYVPCFVFLALSIYSHVTIGLFALVFIGSYALYRPKIILEKSFIVGIGVFSVLVAPHIFSIIHGPAITTGGIPADQWVKSTKMFSYHWYPINMKLFSKNAHREVFPFLLLCFFFLVALRYQDIKNEKNRKILIGCIGCVIMTIIGIIFSDISPIPFLIKVSLQRSTTLISFFGVLYLIFYLCKKVESDNVFITCLSIYSLLILVFASPGIAILPLFLLLYTDIKEEHLGSFKISSGGIKTTRILYLTIAILIIFLSVIPIINKEFKTSNLFPIATALSTYIWHPLQYLNPFYGFDFLIRGGRFKDSPLFLRLLIGTFLLAIGVIFFKRVKNDAFKIMSLSIFLLMTITIVWSLNHNDYSRWHNRYAEIASAYLDVQLWAKNNTANDALFMPDPTHSYGWRDFSERSSFGSLREWGFAAIAYNPNYKTYLEGIKRMKEFEIDIEKVTEEDMKNYETFPYSQTFTEPIRNKYYNMSDDRRMDLAKRYGIDYFVLVKSRMKDLSSMTVAFENEHFIVYKP